MKNPLTPAETFRFAAQHLNHCATAVPGVHGVHFHTFIRRVLTELEVRRVNELCNGPRLYVCLSVLRYE